MRAVVSVKLKGAVLDPQGKAVAAGLASLGYEEVQTVRQGKLFDIELGDLSRVRATERVKEMCERLLANTVIEEYSFQLVD